MVAEDKDCACSFSVTPTDATVGSVETASESVGADRIAEFAKALSDPIRVHMLALMARGSDCCVSGEAARLPEGVRRPAGVCVCEFQRLLGLAQSKASYHLRILRDAGVVRETLVGKWTFYAIDGEASLALLATIREQLGLEQR